MAAQYPFLKICNLNEVEASIAMVENDIMSSGFKEIAHGNTSGQALEKEGKIEVAMSQSTQNSDVSSEPKTIGELQNLPISKWGDLDIIKGAKYSATLQLRTPLRILKHHNELFEGDGSPPNYTKELWEGIWVPKAKTFSELGLAIVELPEATMASDIGPIPSNGGDYLKFLLAIRNIVESNNNIPARRKKLTIELKKEEWEKIINKHGGTDKILNYFFPRFIEMLPSLQKETVSQLKLNKINTAEVFAKKTDKELLSIKWNQRYNSQPK